MSLLSERIRPNVEAAPWVVEEIKKMESKMALHPQPPLKKSVRMTVTLPEKDASALRKMSERHGKKPTEIIAMLVHNYIRPI